MNYRLYGFKIGKDIHFDIHNKCIYRLTTLGKDNNFVFSTIQFNDTMMNLFLYLLLHGRDRVISKDELLKKIWEEKNLTPSSQRLWQVYTSLNKRIKELGVPEQLLQHIKRSGYTVNGDDVIPIYYKINDVPYHYEVI